MDDPRLATTFRRYTASRQATQLQRAVAELAAGDLSRQGLSHLCKRLAIADLAERKAELLDLLLYYVRDALADGELTDQEFATLRDLKRLFRIEEGDFHDECGEEVGELLAVELRRIPADREVDQAEALHKVKLQDAFDLGYDQFLELTRPAVEQVVAELFNERTRTEGADLEWTHRRLLALDTVYDFNAWLDRHAAAILADITQAEEVPEDAFLRQHVPARAIPQQVKDMVWRRDQGRCVECGSREQLEFDHIIPFSRGGSNSYRNIQLLCQDCNRRKADKIG